jgi:hypothetical protein
VTALSGAGPVSAATEIEARKIGTGERRKSSSHTSSEPQARVYDVADPDRHGTILKAGPEVSAVRLDDGQERNIPNVHLRALEAPPAAGHDGLSHPSPVSDVVRLGQEAMARKRRAWEDWLAIAEALEVGHDEVTRALHTNKKHGRRFEKAMGEWLVTHGFKEIDKGTRSRALECLKHKVQIATWRARLTESERWKFNHPDTVLRKWKASTVVPDPNAPPKSSPMQKLKDELVGVIEERDRYKRAYDQGGGDLWSPQDRPQDIAKVIFDQVGKTKAEKVAREIMKLLGGKS